MAKLAFTSSWINGAIELSYSLFSESQKCITFQYEDCWCWNAIISQKSTWKWCSSCIFIDYSIRGITLLFQTRLEWKSSVDKKGTFKTWKLFKIWLLKMKIQQAWMLVIISREIEWCLQHTHRIRITLHKRVIEMHRDSISNMILYFVKSEPNPIAVRFIEANIENDRQNIGHTFISRTHKLFVSST